MIAGKYRPNSAFSVLHSYSASYFLSIIISIDGINGQNLIVATDVGRFQGRIARSANNLSVAVFASVPYAQSPGQLPGTQRFSKTERLQTSADLYDSTVAKPPCARFNIIDGVSFDQTSSEDCFYLTILTPSLSDITCCSPVLFWIPDDGFSDGTTTNELDNEILIDNFVTKNIVIVLANFRKGPFGFYTSGQDDAPGNYGLWDLLEALRFVNTNIKSFGGDPSRVTILGHGYTGTIADLLSVSPLADGLFSGLILMDGTAYDPCIKNENALLSRSQRAAYILNCDDASRNLWNGGQRKVVTGCLKFGPNSATGSLATAITRPMMDTEDPASHFHQLYWYPRVDGQNGVLPDQYEILAAKRDGRIPVLMGVSLGNWAWEMLPVDFQNEDLLLTLYSGGLAFNDSELANKTCDNLLTDQIMLGGEMGPDKLDDLRRKCKERYALLFTGGGNGQEKTMDDYLFFHRAVRAATSFHYLAPMCKTAATFRKQGKWNAYMYSLEYRRNTTYGRAVGAYKNLDMQLTANYANTTYLFDDRDNLIREILLDMLTNFVKNRQPTSQTSKFFTHWYTMGGGNCYMQINGDEKPQMKFGYFADDCNFWINNGV